jgi:hypothetical protein
MLKDLDFKEQVSAIMDSLPTDWSIVMLGHCAEQHGKYHSNVTVNGRVTSIHQSVHPYCGHAYAIKYDSAVDLLRILEKHGWNGNHHFDLTFGRFIGKHKTRSYSIWPPIVMQRDTGMTNNKHHDGFYKLPDGFRSVYSIVSTKFE